tara:strand:+ start:2281 stop:2613 length:333 start_codon:yes stop_codon:yes gene_type:complete
MGASRVSGSSSLMNQRMAGSSATQPSLFGPAADNPFGKGRKPRGEELETGEQQGERQVTQQMIRQIRAEDEGREIPAPERKRRSEYSGQRAIRGMIKQIREQEEARKRAN